MPNVSYHATNLKRFDTSKEWAWDGKRTIGRLSQNKLTDDKLHRQRMSKSVQVNFHKSDDHSRGSGCDSIIVQAQPKWLSTREQN